MMECPRVKSRLFVGFLLGLLALLIVECQSSNERRATEGNSKAFPTSGVSQSQGRKGKQFLFPFVAWPYQQQYYQHHLGYFLLPQTHQSHSQPQQYQYYQYQQPTYQHFHLQQSQPISIRNDGQSYHPNPDDGQVASSDTTPLPMSPAMMFHTHRDVPPVVSVHSAVSVLSRQVEEKVAVASPSHANQMGSGGGMSCKTSNGRVGICQRFSDCFPMIEMEYGGSEEEAHYQHAESYMSSPLVEQLMQNTNTSICSQGGSASWAHENIAKTSDEVCCPRPEYDLKRASIYRVERLQKNGITETGSAFGDREVILPSITQRPPIRTVVSRQLIENKICGQGKSVRPPKSGKKEGGGGLASGKVTGGVEASGPKEFPWMVAVFGKNQKIFCGASLITDRFLLSAAHCFSTFAPADIQKLYVHLGDFNLRTTFDGPHEVRKIEKIIINKGFKIQTYKNDIALLKLDRPVNFTERIQPICLPEPTNDLFEKRQVIVTGWGRKFRYGATTDVLRKVEMPVWNHAECKRVFETFAPGRLLESNICAGDGKRNKDACLGDSGGPAILYDPKGRWVQIGITSWGKGCGNFPGVYTRVDKYLMWITKNLEQYH